LVALLVNQAIGYYLPGVAPVQFEEGDPVKLKVNKLTSVHTQLPYKYYSLPFCKPEKVDDEVENLGEILRGDRIESSDYKIFAGVDDSCRVLCEKSYTADQVKQFSEKVNYEYRVHWIIDNLPAAVPKMIQEANGETTVIYDTGFPLGFKGSDEIPDTKKGQAFINNHINIKLLYHVNPEV